MDGVKNCLIGLSCISVDDRAREIELSRRMMKARNKQIDKGISETFRLFIVSRLFYIIRYEITLDNILFLSYIIL